VPVQAAAGPVIPDRGARVGMRRRLLHILNGTPASKLVESNVPTALNTPARSGRLEAIPLVGDYGSGLGQRRSGSSQLRRRASI
jgi:hypothetical protein